MKTLSKELLVQVVRHHPDEKVRKEASQLIYEMTKRHQKKYLYRCEMCCEYEILSAKQHSVQQGFKAARHNHRETRYIHAACGDRGVYMLIAEIGAVSWADAKELSIDMIERDRLMNPPLPYKTPVNLMPGEVSF